MIRPIAIIVEPSEDGTYEVILVDAERRGYVIAVSRTRAYANYVCVVLAWGQHICAQPAPTPTQPAVGAP